VKNRTKKYKFKYINDNKEYDIIYLAINLKIFDLLKYNEGKIFNTVIYFKLNEFRLLESMIYCIIKLE